MNTNYIYAEIREMATIDEFTYKNLARILISRIGDKEYFNGTVEYECDRMHYALRTTLIVYLKHAMDPGAPAHTTIITEIIPVWWELNVTDTGRLVDNDFSWQEFRYYLL